MPEIGGPWDTSLNTMPNHAEPLIFGASAQDIGTVGDLWSEYWEFAGLSQDFQGFAEELRTLPGRYAEPGGRLLLATVAGSAAGTVAMRPLAGSACEAKRLYVRPEYRGQGVGDALVRRIIKEARASGFREMFADSLPSMSAALRIYRRLGFSETQSYSANPTPGAVFLRLEL